MRGGWMRAGFLKFNRALLCAALMTALSGCNREQLWKLPEITGHLPDLRFSLLSDTGQAVTAQTYQGHLVLLFFGFTRCRAAYRPGASASGDIAHSAAVYVFDPQGRASFTRFTRCAGARLPA